MKKMNNKILPNKTISKWVMTGLRWYLGNIFILNLERNTTASLTPPYLVIGNHTNFYDGFLVNLFIEEPICFLVSDEYFRKPLLRWLLKVEGSIPKKKFLADFSAIKEALKAKAAGRVIGIFPEGKRNWDGSTEKIIFATAKLIKMLKIPVVRALLKGSYLAFPRWARFARKGKISFSYDLILTADKIQDLSIEQIYKEISESLSYREYDFQRKVMNIYTGKNLAEKLELYLFLCPHCHQIGTLYSYKDVLSCQNCGYEVKYNHYGFFSSEKNPLYFIHPADWNQWQISWCKELIEKNYTDGSSAILIMDKGVTLTRVDKDKKLTPLKGCQLFLKGQELILETYSIGILCFELCLIKGINIQYNDHLEFYYKDLLYQFGFENPSISAYKWYKMITLAQDFIK